MSAKFLGSTGLTQLVTLIKNILTLKADSANGSGGVAKRAAAIPFGQVDSTSTSTAFTATIPGITELHSGVCVFLMNGVVTSASGFTVNINNLGAKPVYSTLSAASRSTTQFNVAYTLLLVYNEERVSGGCWDAYYGYDSNTNTIGYQLRTNSTTMPTLDKFYRYRLLFTAADRKHLVPANTSSSTSADTAKTTTQRPIDPFGAIYYYGHTTAISANANPTASYFWTQYSFALGYSFNRTGAALTLTNHAPVYIKCAPQADGSAIIDADNPFVQTLPSTADGKIYIFLGVASSATAVELVPEHPVFCYRNGVIQLWTGDNGSSQLDKFVLDDYQDCLCQVTFPSGKNYVTDENLFGIPFLLEADGFLLTATVDMYITSAHGAAVSLYSTGQYGYAYLLPLNDSTDTYILRKGNTQSSDIYDVDFDNTPSLYLMAPSDTPQNNEIITYRSGIDENEWVDISTVLDRANLSAVPKTTTPDRMLQSSSSGTPTWEPIPDAYDPADGVFMVTLTPTEDDLSGTMDHTGVELLAAYNAGMKVVASVYGMNGTFDWNQSINSRLVTQFIYTNNDVKMWVQVISNSGNTYDTVLYPLYNDDDVSTITNHINNTTVHITAADRTAWNAKYNKPSGGIPASDLASGVIPDISGKANSADVYTKTEVDQKLVSAMDYKGTKATTSDLPTSGNKTGDVWHINADGSERAWNGSAWEELGTAVDLSGKQDVPLSGQAYDNTASGYVTPQQVAWAFLGGRDISIEWRDDDFGTMFFTAWNAVTSGNFTYVISNSMANYNNFLILYQFTGVVNNGNWFAEPQIIARYTDLAEVATSGSYNDLSDKPTIPSEVTEQTVSSWGFTKNTGTYSKPSGGIPKTDLASDVQTSLGKADTALQAHQSLSAYRTASAQDTIDGAQDTAIAAKYTKPSGGIPASDLADGVIPTVPTTEINANTAARHTHSNKALLDSYSQTEANLADAVSKKHSHTNKTVLDGITSSKVSEWDNKQNAISDLATIRSGAAAGATAVQPSAISDMATQTWVGQQGYQTATQVENVIPIKSVQVNGTALTPDANKAVNIQLAQIAYTLEDNGETLYISNIIELPSSENTSF